MTITYNSTNYYLIPCRDGYVLIDAGWVGKLDKFKQCLHSLDIRLDEIRYIFLTHHHHDHAALVQDIKEISGAKLIIHRNQIPYITKGITDYKRIRQYNLILMIIDRLLRPLIKYNYKPIKIDFSDLIIENNIDDSILRRIGVDGRIVETPGHSSDSISILLDNGDAYVGDLAMDLMGVICKIPLPIEAENYTQLKISLKNMINLGAKDFYPSHGGLVTKEKIEDVIKQN